MKLILMRTSPKFTKKEIKKYEDVSKLPYLHLLANTRFKVFDNPKKPKKGIKKAKDDSTFKIKILNALIKKEDLFSFSFVRHPFTR